MAFLQTFDLTIRLKGGILLVIMAEVKKKKSAKWKKRKDKGKIGDFFVVFCLKLW